MALTPTIRNATFNDLPGILDIYNDAILYTTAIYEYKIFTMAKIEQWFEDKQKHDLPVFIADCDGKVAGFATYGPFRLRPGYKYTIEHSVYVHPDFRKRGIAKILLLHLIDFAKAKEIHAIIGGIDASNIVSIDFHKTFGFEEVGYLKEVAYKFGTWLDLKFLQLLLDVNFEPKED